MLGIERNSDEAFLNRLYNMVDNPATDSIASWSQSGTSFIIWNLVEFTRHVMFGNTGPLSNFMPSILCAGGYKFRKVGFEGKELANDNFVRGKPQLLKNIPRPGYFITKQDLKEINNILTKEKEELLAELRKQELQIKELKYYLEHVGISRL